MKKDQDAAAEKKVVTHYDQKKAARKLQLEKEKKEQKIWKIGSRIVCVGILAGIVIAGVSSVKNRQSTLSDPYITIGEHTLTKLEYDYHYNGAVNNYLSSYGSILSYIGLDTTKDFAKQSYMETDKTWKDNFDEMAVEQIKQTKALADDAASAGFSYDLTEDYKQIQSDMAAAAKDAGFKTSGYYKKVYGTYATEENTELFVKERLLTSAYYEDLLSQNKPGADEVKSHYTENKKDYDSVDYRSFTFTTDLAEEATEEEIRKAMDARKADAEEMKTRFMAGEDFENLCAEYAAPEQQSAYQDTASEHSLTEAAGYAGTNTLYADWLFDEARRADDITVAADDVANQYMVAVFVNRSYDEEKDTQISDTIAGERVAEYVEGLTAGYEVVDQQGDLKYLTIEEATVSENSEVPAETETESAK